VNTIDGPTKLVRQDAILGGLSIGQFSCANIFKLGKNVFSIFILDLYNVYTLNYRIYHEMGDFLIFNFQNVHALPRA